MQDSSYVRRQDLGARFNLKTRRAVDLSPNGMIGCVLWTGTLHPQGYGQVWLDGTMTLAHRVGFMLTNQTIPEGMELDHLCRRRHCVNPDHLEPVTHAENIRRAAAAKSQRTHCPRGHAMTPENTYDRPERKSGSCRQCRRLAGQRYEARCHRPSRVR